MKTAFAILLLALTGCQQATPNWAAISFVLGDTIDAPKKTDNEHPKHPLE